MKVQYLSSPHFSIAKGTTHTKRKKIKHPQLEAAPMKNIIAGRSRSRRASSSPRRRTSNHSTKRASHNHRCWADAVDASKARELGAAARVRYEPKPLLGSSRCRHTGNAGPHRCSRMLSTQAATRCWRCSLARNRNHSYGARVPHRRFEGALACSHCRAMTMHRPPQLTGTRAADDASPCRHMGAAFLASPTRRRVGAGVLPCRSSMVA